MFITNNHYFYEIILYLCKQKLRAAYKFYILVAANLRKLKTN